MKLTKKEAERVVGLYKLGKLKSFRLIKGGLVNYNFVLVTDEGEFVLRIIGHKMSNWRKLKIRREFRVLEFLKKNGFKYEIPLPLKNVRKNYFIKINNKKAWVYKKILGKTKKKINLSCIKELATTIAEYHKFIKDFKYKGRNEENGLINWAKEEYKILKRTKPKNKLDYLVKNNLDFFDELLHNSLKTLSKENILLSHGDLDMSNVLFKNNKIFSILDFDDLENSPRIVDLSISIKDSCFVKKKLDSKRFKLFLETYEKINKLTQKEKELIVPYIIRYNCFLFVWYYLYMNKEKENKEKFIKELILETKDLVKKLK